MNLHSRKSAKNVAYIEANNKVFIELNGTIPVWQTGFSCIECAKIFVKKHDINSATEEFLPYSPDEFEWIVDTYGFKNSKNNAWVKSTETKNYILRPDKSDIILNIEDDKNSQLVVGIDSIIQKLDKDFPDIFSCVQLRDVADRASIFAASSRDISKSMVRVKSSNIWSYTINIKDAKQKVGDVYVQFKSQNGGPQDVYVYYDVPIALWRKWITAPSKGHFFWQFIRNNFLYRKLTGDKRTHLRNGLN